MVNSGEGREDGMTAEQRSVLGEGGEGGRPEPKSPEDWAGRGAAGGEPGRAPPTPGGSSQGSGDRTGASGGERREPEHAPKRSVQPKPGEG